MRMIRWPSRLIQPMPTSTSTPGWSWRWSTIRSPANSLAVAAGVLPMIGERRGGAGAGLLPLLLLPLLLPPPPPPPFDGFGGGGGGPEAAVKTQGRACLTARMLSLVILNSISMAKGSLALGRYSLLNRSWTVVRCRRNWSIWPALIKSVPGSTRLEAARTYHEPLRATRSSSGTEWAGGLVIRSSPSWVLM